MAGPVTPVRAGVLLAAALLAGPAAAGDLADRMAALAASHPTLATMTTLGSSAGGAPLSALTIAAGRAPLADRQGLLVVSGLDGRRHGDGELLLSVARRLLDDGLLTERLNGQALVFLAVADPAGAAARVDGRGGNRSPNDADRDGRTDEDGPDDLDGDGLITWMRVPDGAGEWVIDEHDPRALRKAGDDERGTHRLLLEGLDNDGDGEFSEDGGEGVLIDRNFSHGFVEHTATGGAYPLSEPESRALATYLLEHPGLTTVVVVGEDDTLVSGPKKAGKVERGGWRGGFVSPLDGLLEDDLSTMELFTELFDEAAEGKHEVKGDGPHDGSLLAWSYHQAGRWPVGIRSWSAPEDFPSDDDAEESGDDDSGGGDENEGDATESADGEVVEAMIAEPVADEAVVDSADTDADAESADADDADDDKDKPTSDPDSPVPAAVLAWLDAERDGEGFVPWAAFDHPDLGMVEIGGLSPGLLVNPPTEASPELTERLATFLLDVIEARPALTVEDVELTAHGGGLVTVALALVNTGRLPTGSQFGADADLVRPLRVSLELPEGASRVNGPAQVLVDRLDGLGGRRELRWVLSGAASGATLTVLVDSDVANDLSLELTLP